MVQKVLLAVSAAAQTEPILALAERAKVNRNAIRTALRGPETARPYIKILCSLFPVEMEQIARAGEGFTWGDE